MTDSGLCDSSQSQLVIVDIQQRLAGIMAEADRERVIKQSGILMQAANTLTIPTILTEQYPKGLGSTVEGVSDLISPESPLIEKTCFACSGSSAFCQAIANNQRKQVILAGMESHICVLQTALELRNDGYHVYVVEDAVCSRYKLNHHNALSRMRQAGISITNTESVLFEWLRDARHEHFKALSALIK